MRIPMKSLDANILVYAADNDATEHKVGQCECGEDMRDNRGRKEDRTEGAENAENAEIGNAGTISDSEKLGIRNGRRPTLLQLPPDTCHSLFLIFQLLVSSPFGLLALPIKT